MPHWIINIQQVFTEHGRARLSQCVSEAVVDDRKVIPAAQVRYAFGGDDGNKAENDGGGGHVSARSCCALGRASSISMTGPGWWLRSLLGLHSARLVALIGTRQVEG
jgi:hypothetical protein